VAQRRPADAGVTDPARRALLVAATALPVACAASGGGPAGPVSPPTLRVGDRWRYQLVNRFNDTFVDAPTWEVVSVAPELRLTASNVRGGGTRDERWAGAWTVRDETIFGIAMTFAEPLPLVPMPIEAGRTVSTSTTYVTSDDPRARRWSQRLSTGPWETVEVPAGRYECLRIRRAVSFEHPNPFRSASTRSETLWYAPAVGRWVQREWRGDFVSLGMAAGMPAEGLKGDEDWQMLQLTAWLPAPTAG
jgi:hypothetical protein